MVEYSLCPNRIIGVFLLIQLTLIFYACPAFFFIAITFFMPAYFFFIYSNE